MTHAEWLAATDPRAMLDFLKGRASDRKLRLFAVACCRQAWGLLTDARSRAAVETAERFADGAAGIEELNRAWDAAWHAVRGYGPLSEWEAACVAAKVASTQACIAARDASRESQAPLLRAVVGDPFAPVVGEPAWRTPTVSSLAHAAYDERLDDGRLDPDRLAVLADAMEEAGCVGPECGWCYGQGWVVASGTPYDQPEAETCVDCHGLGWTASPVLTALRSPGPHYRGHWALDLILGKE